MRGVSKKINSMANLSPWPVFNIILVTPSQYFYWFGMGTHIFYNVFQSIGEDWRVGPGRANTFFEGLNLSSYLFNCSGLCVEKRVAGFGVRPEYPCSSLLDGPGPPRYGFWPVIQSL